MTTPVTPQAPDTTPPTAPTALTATAAGATQIDLVWTASTDNMGVTGYKVERCQGTGCTSFVQVATPIAPSFADTGLASATAYSYRVLATDAAGNPSGYSNTASATTSAPDTIPPTVPMALTATPGSSSQINLTWSASTDNVAVSGYRVEHCQGVGCTSFAQVATATGTTFSDAGLAPNTSHSYRVRAADAAGNLSGYSNTASATTLTAPDTTPPAAPTGLAATVVSTSQIDLTWTASTDNVGVTGYRVERCQGTNCTTFVQVGTPPGTNFSNTGLVSNTNYRFRVRAVDGTGNLSGYSGIVLARTLAPDTTRPSAPTGLTATGVSNTQINLSWTASTDNVGVTGYRVERCQGAGCTSFVQVGTPTGTTFSSTGLQPSTTYRHRVRATDAAGNLSNYSSVVGASTQAAPPDTTPPSVPSAPAAVAVSQAQINFSWTASTDNVGVTGYRVERCQGAGCASFVQVATPAGPTFNDSGLSADTSYSYRVRAADAAGNLSGYSSTVSAATPPAAPDTTPPSAPAGLTATAVSNSQINLSWTASTDNVGVTGYHVERCQGEGCANFAQVGTATGTTFNNPGLTVSTSYSYRVRAADAAGNLSGYSNVASAATPSILVGLVAAYAFSEGVGTTAADASGNGNVGTIAGATWTTQGRFGPALSFNGVNNVVQVPASASLNVTSAMTLEAWIFPTASQGGWRTIMQRQADAYFLNASNSSGPLRPSGGGTIGSGLDYVSGTTANPVNAWTHVALTYDGAMLRLYVNGVQAASEAKTGSIQTTTNPLWIGGNTPYGEYFQGVIDEIRIYNRALSAAEIQADMTTPIVP